MNHTEHYNLNQWEASDKVQRTDFNADNAKIDAAIAAVDTKADGKADASALAALTATVAGKGNCQIEWGSYVGREDANHTRTINFSFSPKVVIIGGGAFTVAIRGTSYFVTADSISYAAQLTWGEKSLTWTYSLRDTSGSSYSFFDGPNTTYFWVALG